MRILGILKPVSEADHRRARFWAAGPLAALAVMMAALLVMTPPPEEADLAPVALRASQIEVFQEDVGLCRSAMLEAGYAIEPLPNLREANGCGYQNAIELKQSVHPYSGPVTTSCAAAAALALWERDVVGPAAERRFGQPIARIELAGPAYSCRRIAGRSDRRLSEHAHANAIDIQGFTLADGRVVTVAGGWRGTRADRAFLRDVRDGACDYFQAVLSPDYNRAHRDHLHFDLGRDDMCR